MLPTTSIYPTEIINNTPTNRTMPDYMQNILDMFDSRCTIHNEFRIAVYLFYYMKL